MTTLKDLEITYDRPHWCPGCGNFGIWVALKNAITQLGLNPWEVVLVSGIGCSSKVPYWVRTYGFNGLHGRPLPVAEGIKLANHKLTVIVIGGDGDQYGEGGNHIIHAARRNVDLTLIVHNNQVYALTTGQISPTSDLGTKNKVEPQGVVEPPLNPISLALSSGATFVARGFAGDVKQQTELLVKSVKHKGFAIVDTLQPCVTFNHVNTSSRFIERVYKLDEGGHNRKDKVAAFKKAEEWPLKQPLKAGEKERIPTGVFYQEERATWHEQIPQIEKIPLVKQSIGEVGINSLIEDFV